MPKAHEIRRLSEVCGEDVINMLQIWRRTWRRFEERRSRSRESAAAPPRARQSPRAGRSVAAPRGETRPWDRGAEGWDGVVRTSAARAGCVVRTFASLERTDDGTLTEQIGRRYRSVAGRTGFRSCEVVTRFGRSLEQFGFRATLDGALPTAARAPELGTGRDGRGELEATESATGQAPIWASWVRASRVERSVRSETERHAADGFGGLGRPFFKARFQHSCRYTGRASMIGPRQPRAQSRVERSVGECWWS